MDRTFTVTYTPQIVRSATRHFWRQSGGLRHVLTGATFSAAFLAYLGLSGNPSAWAGGMGVLIAVAVLMPLLRYHVYLSGAMDKLRKMGSPEATLRFTDDAIGIQSGMGSSEIPWRTIEYVWAFPDAWLMFIGKDAYFTLPTGPMDAEVQAYLRQMVTQHGGKCR